MATIAEVLRQTDELKPNQYTELQKIQWLSECEHMIYTEIISRHENSGETFNSYDAETSKETVLLAIAPYDTLYRHYLMMQIDLANQEYARYNNSSGVFNAMYHDYRAWYTRSRMPVCVADHLKL